MPPRPYRPRNGAKLDLYDVAAIKAWCEGPGRHLQPNEQAKRLGRGIEGWWENTTGVGHNTLHAIACGISWQKVRADSVLLRAWRSRLERLKTKGPLGLDVVG